MEADDSITSINLQLSKIDVPVICKNTDYLTRDIEKVTVLVIRYDYLQKENQDLGKKIALLEKT